MVRAAAIAASALALVLQLSLAQADVHWAAPPDCPNERAFRSAVRNHAGRDVTADIRINVRRGDGRWYATVGYSGNARALEGDSCAAVFEAAALVVGLSWRKPQVRSIASRMPRLPVLVPPPLLPTPTPQALSRPPTVRGTAARVLAPQPRSLPSSWVVRLDVGPGLATMANVRTSLGASAGTVASGFSLHLGADYGFDVLSDSADIPGIQTSARRLTGKGRACGTLRWLWLCAGLEMGAMTLFAQSDTAHATAHGWWVATYAGPELRWLVSGGVALIGAMDVVVPLVSPRFTMGDRTLQGSAPLWARLLFGVQAAF